MAEVLQILGSVGFFIIKLHHHQAAVQSSEPGHSMSHPDAWYQTKTKGLAPLLSTTFVFVTQLFQP